jgi:hypothetical protein
MMKKILMMMALVATALFVVTACDKKDDDDNGGNGGNEDSGIVTLTAPPYKNEARVLNITQNNSDGIKQLRLMESGGYMITRQASSVRTRGGSGDEDYEFGKFTYSGGKYVLDNGMTISVEQSGQNVEVTITWKNGTSIKTTGSIDSGDVVTAGIFTDNLCSRPWKVERVIVSAEFEGKKLGKEFKGPIDLAEVKAWYENNFGTLKDQFAANTIVEGIYFDSKGLFAINYQNRNDDVGVWRWTNLNNGDLGYNWYDKQKAISLFTGNAAVEFTKSPESCKLILKGTVNSIDFEFAFYMK